MDMTEIRRDGNQIIVPTHITLEQAIETLMRQIKYEQEVVQINETIEGCFWDGAYAFYLAMKEEFGWVHAEAIPSMFGETKPQMHSIACGVGKTVLVPYGKFTLPGINGWVQSSYEIRGGRLTFSITSQVKRTDEAKIRRLAEKTRTIVQTQSLYRGKAIRLRFKSDIKSDGEPQRVEPQFMDVRHVSAESLILPAVVEQAVASSVFTPIEHSVECRKHGIPLKRGALFAGVFGTGKTLAAYVTAKKCEDNGWTFIYCERAEELAEAVRFAHSYQPAAIFCEDIDRVLSGDRSVDMDDILNIIDGIESKGTEIMTILTTNNLPDINKAMLRPGRLDAVIEFTKPDAVAAARLVRYYGKGLVAEDLDLAAIGNKLDGKIPAVIRECVERAKLSQIKIGASDNMIITTEALLDAADGLNHQLELIATGSPELSEHEILGRAVGNVVKTSLKEAADES